MSADPESRAANVSVRTEGDWLEIALSGEWRLTESCPVWGKSVPVQEPAPVRFRDGGLGYWDTSLLLFIFDAQ